MSEGAILVVTGMAFEAAIAAGAGVEVFYRSGAGGFETALAERLRRPCAGVISFGVAGGLAPGLKPGDIVVPAAVVDHATTYATDVRWSTALRAALTHAFDGVLAASDVAVTGVAGKAAVHARGGALAVDMESHMAARQALAVGVPFAACRIVIDPFDRAVPSAALVALDENGRTNIPALLGELLRHPGQIPELMRLGRDASVAKQAMRAARAALGSSYAFPQN